MRIIGVDTGGTFTDIIYKDGDEWRAHKLLSTPQNPAEAVLAGLRVVADEAHRTIVHGSTVATNAILERKGAPTVLVTNQGFTDIIAIGRQHRSRLYDLAYRHEPSIAPETMRFPAPGRMDRDGVELEPLTDADAKAVAAAIKTSPEGARAESVAVCLLFSFANPAHERRLGEALAALGLPVSLSHEIVSEFREFERMSTTLVNAYVSPRMMRYLTFLEDRLRRGDALRIMQSNGGAIAAGTARKESVRTILSGPAGGCVGALAVGTQAGFPRCITFDMGGTSTDVSLLDGALTMTMEAAIAGYPVKTPMIDIHTVGAGGGSIAGVDAGGSLTVGPESAGADPGPICYGKGESITVTDANLFLGRLAPEHFLGGDMKLDMAALPPAFEALAAQLGLTPEQAAEGVIAVANANMERAIRVISVERGHDPREFALFSFGGAGGLHAVALARLLNMETVLIPKNPGILSAMGMVMADIVKDYSQTVMVTPSLQADSQQGAAEAAAVAEAFAPLAERAVADLRAEGVEEARITLEHALDMRYEGQSYELVTPYAPVSGEGESTSPDEALAAALEAFHHVHEKAYGYRNPARPVQVVNVRLRASGAPEKPTLHAEPLEGESPPAESRLGERAIHYEGAALTAQLLQREALRPGNKAAGPAVLVEYTSTVFIPPGAEARVDGYGNLVIAVGGESA